MKTCARCHQPQPLEAFHRSRGRADGLMPYCKTCTRAYSAQHYAANRDRIRAAVAKRRALITPTPPRPYQPDPVRAAALDKTYARKAVSHALTVGMLARPDGCERCGVVEARIEAHHPDHSKPLEVEWLCSSCHGALRRLSHCGRGHEMDDSNIYVDRRGRRYCRLCMNLRSSRWKSRRRNPGVQFYDAGSVVASRSRR